VPRNGDYNPEGISTQCFVSVNYVTELRLPRQVSMCVRANGMVGESEAGDRGHHMLVLLSLQPLTEALPHQYEHTRSAKCRKPEILVTWRLDERPIAAEMAQGRRWMGT
jgi:hypothetical protein